MAFEWTSKWNQIEAEMNAKRKTHDDNANLISVIENMKRSSDQSGRKIDILTARQKIHPKKKWVGIGVWVADADGALQFDGGVENKQTLRRQ